MSRSRVRKDLCVSTRSLVVVFEHKHMQPPPPSLPRTYFHISPTLTHAQYTHITAPYPTLCIVINRKKGELHNNKKRTDRSIGFRPTVKRERVLERDGDGREGRERLLVRVTRLVRGGEIPVCSVLFRLFSAAKN